MMRRDQNEHGSSFIEVALMAPWIFFLFVLILDFGFYAYAAICTQNAARAAALATAYTDDGAGSQALACFYAREEMRYLPNYSSLPLGCNAAPLNIAVTKVAAADDASKWASRVQITYQSIPMIPIPGLMMGQLTLQRTVEVRVFGD